MAKMPAMLDAQKQLEKLSGTYDTENGWRNKLKKYEAVCYCYWPTEIVLRSSGHAKELLILEIMPKRITTKESDIVKPWKK
jgi:outer membrane protein